MECTIKYCFFAVSNKVSISIKCKSACKLFAIYCKCACIEYFEGSISKSCFNFCNLLCCSWSCNSFVESCHYNSTIPHRKYFNIRFFIPSIVNYPLSIVAIAS